MPTKKLFLTFAFIVLVLSSAAWAMDNDLSDIESHIYKIKNKASGSCLSSSVAETDKICVLMERDTQDEHTSNRLWYFEKTGDFYKIKNKANGNCLSSDVSEIDRNNVFMGLDTQDEHTNNRLWYLEKVEGFYKIKNKFNGTCLSSGSAFETASNNICLTVDAQDEHTNYRLWYFENAGELGQTKNESCGTCSDRCESEKDNDKKNVQGEQAKSTMWYAGGCGPCATPANAYATGQSEDGVEIEVDSYTLFKTSFLSGAAYSLVPEIVRDALVSRGYSRVSNVVATIVQGGIIVYHSPSYIAPLSGMVVRIGCDQLGFSPKVSAIASSTVAVVISLSEKLIYSQETVLDSVIDVAIGFAGSYAGSTLALKAKSWVYGLLARNKPITVCEKSCQPHAKAC